MEGIPIKCVVLGDGNVGKTSLMITYTAKAFPTDYVPILYDGEEIKLIFNESTVLLKMWDIPGPSCVSPRPLHYSLTDVFLLCFSLVCPSSYESICRVWFPEIRRHCPNTPFILVGTKLDLLHDGEIIKQLKEQNIVPITTAQGLQMGKEIKAEKYMECSSLTQDGLEELMEEAICIGLHYKSSSSRKKRCSVI